MRALLAVGLLFFSAAALAARTGPVQALGCKAPVVVSDPAWLAQPGGRIVGQWMIWEEAQGSPTPTERRLMVRDLGADQLVATADDLKPRELMRRSGAAAAGSFGATINHLGDVSYLESVPQGTPDPMSPTHAPLAYYTDLLWFCSAASCPLRPGTTAGSQYSSGHVPVAAIPHNAPGGLLGAYTPDGGFYGVEFNLFSLTFGMTSKSQGQKFIRSYDILSGVTSTLHQASMGVAPGVQDFFRVVHLDFEGQTLGFSSFLVSFSAFPILIQSHSAGFIDINQQTQSEYLTGAASLQLEWARTFGFEDGSPAAQLRRIGFYRVPTPSTGGSKLVYLNLDPSSPHFGVQAEYGAGDSFDEGGSVAAWVHGNRTRRLVLQRTSPQIQMGAPVIEILEYNPTQNQFSLVETLKAIPPAVAGQTEHMSLMGADYRKVLVLLRSQSGALVPSARLAVASCQ